jgi:AcrR family transcriptional regulator
MTAEPVQTDAPSRGRRTQDSRARLLAAARRLFVGRGYHATRPQDISREAGLGHGTFYLHFADKQACFLAFTDEARTELDAHVKAFTEGTTGLEEAIRRTLEGVYDYGEKHPGVLATAMTDASVIATEGARGETLVDRWAVQWGTLLIDSDLAPEERGIVGAAIVGIIHEGSGFARRHGRPPQATIDFLTRLILKALT